MNKKLWQILFTLMIVALLAAACAAPVTTAPATATTAPAPATNPPATSVPSATPASGKIGGTVSVMAVWGGSELDSFNAMIKPFEDATGIQVEYEGTRDLEAVLGTRIKGGNPPDLAGMPGVGQLQAYADQGAVVPLNDILDMNAMKQQYDQGWLDLGTYKGKLYGIFSKAAVKSLVWYNPKAFKAAGYQVPTSWAELLALTDKIRNDGKTPWCIGTAGDWPGKDWVADIYLQLNGPDMYDKWVNHQIPWTDQSVKNAYLEWGKIVLNDKNVFGGKQGVMATAFDVSPFPLFSDPPGCYMHHQANFITDFILKQFPNLKPVDDFDFFVMPPVDPAKGSPLMTAGDLFSVLKDTPQSRALINYLVTADAQSIWAKRGGFLSANKTVPSSVYPDPVTQHVADMLAKASAVRFGAGDQLPGAVGAPFSDSILKFIQTPADLDSLLAKIEAAAKDAYK